ncbi:hypothetical protein [Pontibacter liquoris]|uniref:hypothetical protein n=1 Tax=Pontibacter liquoris TaxID=2905677 RepID=UPI001FA7C042|nr:hypothetical protein [Pontibacter liquoris]
MKKLLLPLLLLLVVAGTSCDKIEDLLTFYINHDESIKIESSFPVGALVPLTPVTVTTNSNEEFKNNKTRAELVKNVTLSKLALTVTDPQGENFNFLKSIEIYISSDAKGETKIAYLNEVPQNATSLELTSTNAKLDEYLKSDTYTIRTKAALAKPVSSDITIKAAMRFKVTADPL